MLAETSKVETDRRTDTSWSFLCSIISGGGWFVVLLIFVELLTITIYLSFHSRKYRQVGCAISDMKYPYLILIKVSFMKLNTFNEFSGLHYTPDQNFPSKEMISIFTS
jgi:hypothetical protein